MDKKLEGRCENVKPQKHKEIRCTRIISTDIMVCGQLTIELLAEQDTENRPNQITFQ